MRRDARVGAFKLIFETLFKDAEEETKAEIVSSIKKEEDIAFCNSIFDSYQTHKQDIQEMVSKSVKNFAIDRVYKADLAIVYTALTEIKYLETPKAVAINEAVEIAKKYSTTKSSKFINGLLSSVVSEK